jgi:hypothetical protein
MSYTVLNRDEHFSKPGPKRILALDGGGLRGILTLAMLLEVEAILKQRHGDSDQFRLCHYFDLIAGTSTGAIIAAALAQGMSVSEIIEKYHELGNKVFKKSLFRLGMVRALYGKKKLISELKKVFGADTTLGSDRLQTGLLVVTKRLDTGSPWPLSNNPQGKYFAAREGSKAIPNADYPLWQVVRASTAAPRYFSGESIDIVKEKGKEPVSGVFVDGGVSPFNNPALQAVMFSTLNGYRVNWQTGKDRLLVISLGTGARDPRIDTSFMEVGNALKSLVALMDDCSALVETMMQWMSSGSTARDIDGEIGALENDLIGGQPLFSYQRYNVELSKGYLRDELDVKVPKGRLKSLTEMDAPENMEILQSIGEVAGKKLIQGEHFPAEFDLN